MKKTSSKVKEPERAPSSNLHSIASSRCRLKNPYRRPTWHLHQKAQDRLVLTDRFWQIKKFQTRKLMAFRRWKARTAPKTEEARKKEVRIRLSIEKTWEAKVSGARRTRGKSRLLIRMRTRMIRWDPFKTLSMSLRMVIRMDDRSISLRCSTPKEEERMAIMKRARRKMQ